MLRIRDDGLVVLRDAGGQDVAETAIPDAREKPLPLPTCYGTGHFEIQWTPGGFCLVFVCDDGWLYNLFCWRLVAR